MRTDDRDAANLIDFGATESDTGPLSIEDDGFDGDSGAEHGLDREVDPPTPPRPTVEERFGRSIMRLRLYLGWSQRDLQRTCGVHQSQISRLETGHQHGLSSRRLFAILRALHVGEIAFLPPPTNPPTALEIMLRGDPWERAGRAVERRVARAAERKARRQSPS